MAQVAVAVKILSEQLTTIVPCVGAPYRLPEVFRILGS